MKVKSIINNKETWVMVCDRCRKQREFDHPNWPNVVDMARAAGWIIGKMFLCKECASMWDSPTPPVNEGMNDTRTTDTQHTARKENEK